MQQYSDSQNNHAEAKKLNKRLDIAWSYIKLKKMQITTWWWRVDQYSDEGDGSGRKELKRA